MSKKQAMQSQIVKIAKNEKLSQSFGRIFRKHRIKQTLLEMAENGLPKPKIQDLTFGWIWLY